MSVTVQSLRRWDGGVPDLPGWSAIEVAGEPSLYVARGPGAGANLLLLPGVFDPWHGYLPVLRRLVQHFTVWCADWRGHGLSGRADGAGYHVANYLADTVRIVDEAVTGDLIVAGNSLGALVAAGVAAARPARVSGVVLEDGPFFITEPDRWADHRLRSAVFGNLATLLRAREEQAQDGDAFAAHYADRRFAFVPAGDDASRRRWAGKLRTLLDDFEGPPGRGTAIARMVDGGQATWGELFPASVIRDIAARYAHVDAAAAEAVAACDFSAGFDHRAALAAITCPVLVIEADRDLSGLLEADDMRTLLASIGSGTPHHRYLEGALHETHQTAPDAYRDAVVDFAGTL